MSGTRNENKIREAFDQIQLPEGAQERMYQNILKKAQEASDSSAFTAASDSSKTENKKVYKISWKKYLSLAACLVIFIGAGLMLPSILDKEPTIPDDPPILAGSPFVDVAGPEDFDAQLGFSINAPAGAEDIGFCIAYENTAIVTFLWNDHYYNYSASKDAESVSSDGNALEDVLMENWQVNDISFCLENTDGAEESDFETLVQELMVL